MMVIKLEQSDTTCAEIYAIPLSLKRSLQKIMDDKLFDVTSPGNK